MQVRQFFHFQTFFRLLSTAVCVLQLTAAIVFLSVGVVAAFLCLLVDGACVALSMVGHMFFFNVCIQAS